MDNYAQILENVAQKEVSEWIFSLVILFLVVVVVWIAMVSYAGSVKKKEPKRYYSEWESRIRRRGFVGCIGMTALCIGLGVIFSLGRKTTFDEIQQDILDESYIVYEGCWYLESDKYISPRSTDDEWVTLDIDDNLSAFLHLDTFPDWSFRTDGEYQGKLVYGKNSLIVVDIQTDRD